MDVDANEPASGQPTPISERRVAAHPASLAALAFERTPVGLAVVDERGRVQAANPRFCELLGVTREAVHGRSLVDHLPMADLRQTAEADSPSWCPLVLESPSGENRELLVGLQAIAAEDMRAHYLLSVMGADEAGEAISGQDSFTGMLSVALFQDRLVHGLERAEILDQGLAVLQIAVDGLPALIQRVGSAVARDLLRRVSHRIGRTFRVEDSMAYLGEGRWGVLLEHPVSPNSLQMTALRFLEAMDAPFDVPGGSVLLTTSVGIACYPEDGDSDASLFAAADTALARARRSGPGRHDFFSRHLRRRLEDHQSDCLELQEALLSPGRHFQVVYQPRVDPADGHCRRVEALVRWSHPRRGLLHPRHFMPLVSELDQRVRLNRWVLERVIVQHRQWREQGSPLAALGVSVNLDATLLEQHVFDDRPLDHFLRQQRDDLSWLSLEVEVSGLVEQGQEHRHLLKRLGQLGITLLADAFGSASIDLMQLALLPLGGANISPDRVVGIGEKRHVDQALAALHHCLATLDIDVTLVGIETASQRDAAIAMGVQGVQGNLLSPPLDETTLADWLVGQASPA